ncbi:MAG: TIGR02206 family membrane protein, partial [Clostridia bacterium]|nr:TIGR02206 family membrane protein [Clostridia bacterium]
MKVFFSYFFGQGTETEFTNFTMAHFLPIILMILAVLLIYRFRNQIKNCRAEKNIRLGLAFALI